MTDARRTKLQALWNAHVGNDFAPDAAADASLAGNDTLIAGVISSILDPGQPLRAGQHDVLENCLCDLEQILPELSGESETYARRLHEMAQMALTL